MIQSAWYPFSSETSLGSVLLALPVLFSVGYWLFTAHLLKRRTRPVRLPLPAVDLPPVTFLRPVKQGIPRLDEKVKCLLQSARPGDRVIFAVDTVQDYDLCTSLCESFTPDGIGASVILTPPASPFTNPKVAKLIAMEADADWGPPHWILSDAETLPTRAFFDAFRTEWQQSAAAVLTSGYHFTGAQNLPQRLDHLPALLTLWPGLLAADYGASKEGGLGFTLGACIGLHRNDLRLIGGWEPLRDQLAEDNRLGAALAQHGRPARLSHAVITLDSDPLGWRDCFFHQHRMAFTYRVCNPWGTLGMSLTFGIPWALLFALMHPGSLAAWSLFTSIVLFRVAHTRWMSRQLQKAPEQALPAFTLTLLLASLAEALFWIMAWLPLPVRWGRRSLRVDHRGTILVPPTEATSAEIAVAPLKD